MPAPPPSPSSVASPTSGSSFSSYSSNSTSSNTSMDRQPSDLMDQLKNSPETRFHAAWLFLRFFYLTMSPERNSGPRNNVRNLSRQSSLNSVTGASTNQKGRDIIIWDIAIACLVLGVKLLFVFLALCLLVMVFRDFLHPLLPVCPYEFLALALRRLSYEDLEVISSLFSICR